MHAEVKEFISKVKEKYPSKFNGCRVLELGSLNINGTPREFFDNCEYYGIDQTLGECVDEVCKAHEFKSKKKFDVVITTEMLEHDKYADLSIKNALKLLKKDGILIGTCANINRPPHFEFVGEDNHYENISKERVYSWGNVLLFEEDNDRQDARFVISVI